MSLDLWVADTEAHCQPVDLAQSYLLLNHGPVTLVSTAHGGRQNVMAASWAMPLDFAPPKVLLVVDSGAWTRELMEASGEFILNIPARRIAAEVLAAGSQSGRDGDKFAACNIGRFAAEKVAAPRIAGCVAWLECRIVPEPHNQHRYDLFIGEVVAAGADARVFRDGNWQFDDDALRTLHYLSGGRFLVSGETLQMAK